MTKVYDWTQESSERVGDPIDFTLFITHDGTIRGKGMLLFGPEAFDYVALVHRADGYNKYDLMAAWNENQSAKSRYLGHWNGGYVND